MLPGHFTICDGPTVMMRGVPTPRFRSTSRNMPSFFTVTIFARSDGNGDEGVCGGVYPTGTSWGGGDHHKWDNCHNNDDD